MSCTRTYKNTRPGIIHPSRSKWLKWGAMTTRAGPSPRSLGDREAASACPPETGRALKTPPHPLGGAAFWVLWVTAVQLLLTSSSAQLNVVNLSIWGNWLAVHGTREFWADGIVRITVGVSATPASWVGFVALLYRQERELEGIRGPLVTEWACDPGLGRSLASAPPPKPPRRRFAAAHPRYASASRLCLFLFHAQLELIKYVFISLECRP